MAVEKLLDTMVNSYLEVMRWMFPQLFTHHDVVIGVKLSVCLSAIFSVRSLTYGSRLVYVCLLWSPQYYLFMQWL